jgi:hypothetical protein
MLAIGIHASSLKQLYLYPQYLAQIVGGSFVESLMMA